MRILLFSQFAGSMRHGMVFRNYALAREWVRQGHNVTVVASSFSHSRISQPQVNGPVTEEYIDGIQYLWVRGLRYGQFNTVRRVVAEGIYAARCRTLFDRHARSYDVVICSSPPPFLVYQSRSLSRRWGARFVFDMRDIFAPLVTELSKRSRNNPYIRMLQHAEDYGCRHADLVVSVPRNAEPYLRKRGLPEGRFLHVGNGIVSMNLAPEPLAPKDERLIAELKRKQCFLTGYAGSLTIGKAVHVAVEAIALARKQVHLLIVGDGACKRELIDLAHHTGVADRVHLLGALSPGQVVSFLERLDVAYMGTRKTRVFSLGLSPTKLNNYMLAAKPILYAVSDPGNPVELAGCGLVCEAENPEAVAETLQRLAALSEQELQRMGEKGRQWCLAHQQVSDHAAEILAHLARLPARHS